MNRLAVWWRRLHGWWVTMRTFGAIADRECRHDGTEPKCDDCIRSLAGW